MQIPQLVSKGVRVHQPGKGDKPPPTRGVGLVDPTPHGRPVIEGLDQRHHHAGAGTTLLAGLGFRELLYVDAKLAKRRRIVPVGARAIDA